MTVRTPVYYNGTDIQEMNATQINEWKTYIAYLYGTDPSVTISVVASSGTLSPTMADTRQQAGSYSSRVDRFPTEGETAEPSTVTVNYDKMTGPTYNTALSATADTNNVAFPAYYDGNDIVAMTLTDYLDTFIYPVLSTMNSSSESADTNGTYTISTSSSVSNYTLVSATPVFSDTRANTGAYTAGGIPETLYQPTTITNYYLQRRSDARSFPSQALLLVDTSGNLNQVDLTSDTSSFNAILKNDIRHYAAEDTAGNKLSYNINGTGNSRGSSIVDTRLNGSGNYQTRFVNINDYRAQEFPNGSAATISTWTLKITQV